MSYSLDGVKPLLGEAQSVAVVESKSDTTQISLSNGSQKRRGKRTRGDTSAEGAIGDKVVSAKACTRRAPAELLDCHTPVVMEVCRNPAAHQFIFSSDTPAKCILDKSAQAILNACLDALFYHDGKAKLLTHNTLRLIEDAISRVGEANALFLEGLRSSADDLNYLLEAEMKGCDHPVLYYTLGSLYSCDDRFNDMNITKTLDYYDKAIKGGCTWAYRSIYHLHKGRLHGEDGDVYKAFMYALELEQSGIIDGNIHDGIGDCYNNGLGCPQDDSMARQYHQRVIDLGLTPSHVYETHSGWHGSSHPFVSDMDSSMLSSLDAEEKGLGVKDDRNLDHLVNQLIQHQEYHPSLRVLGKFKTVGEMALHYCDVLIQRGSPSGYHRKGTIYSRAYVGVSRNDSKARSIWEAADRLGLASWDTYENLIDTTCDVLKGREYREKALQVAGEDWRTLTTITAMVRVYEYDSPSDEQKGSKLLACWERGLLLASGKHTRAIIYRKMAELYSNRVPPLAYDGKKILEYYIKAAQSAPNWMKSAELMNIANLYMNGIDSIPQNGAMVLAYCARALPYTAYWEYASPSVAYQLMARVYGEGIPPVAQDIEKANELRRIGW